MAVRSTTRPSIVIHNSTHGVSSSHGFWWCIDHTNSIVYAKISGSQPQFPPYSAAYFEVDDDAHKGALCRFHVTHWASGDVVTIDQQDNLVCNVAYTPWPLPGKDGITNVSITVM